MSHYHNRVRPASPHQASLQHEILDDPIVNAILISHVLPDIIRHAESAGLSIIAQHLVRDLRLSEKVAAAGGAVK